MVWEGKPTRSHSEYMSTCEQAQQDDRFVPQWKTPNSSTLRVVDLKIGDEGDDDWILDLAVE